MKRPETLGALLVAGLLVTGLLAACAGPSIAPENPDAGRDAGADGGTDGGSGGGADGGPTNLQRLTAARTTAESNSLCTAIAPFYWEIGDKSATLAFGTAGGTAPTSVTPMYIASASKWVFAAWMLELRAGSLSADEQRFLHFQSGYTNFDSCSGTTTVQACLDSGTNGAQTAADVGRFSYGGGHIQKLAALSGLGPADDTALTGEYQRLLGTELALGFATPQLAGGMRLAPFTYAALLRKVLAGTLKLKDHLGEGPVCTLPSACPSAAYSPWPEAVHYAVGHWVEDAPGIGDGAFSSPGAFGFYPWIDAGKVYYGVLARQDLTDKLAYFASVQCGRLVRKAWLTGIAQ